MFKECLKYNIVPFIIEDNLKMFYYRGLKEWNSEKGYFEYSCAAEPPVQCSESHYSCRTEPVEILCRERFFT